MTASGGFTGNTWPLSGQHIKTCFPHQNPSPFTPSASCLPPPLLSTPLSPIPPFPFPLPYLPTSLTLREHLDVPSENEEVDDSGFNVPHPDLNCELYEIRGTPDSNPADVPLPSTLPAPMGQQVPPGYSHYDKSDFNHGNHGSCITLQPFGTPLFPYYIKFEHNFASNQHYVYGLCDDTKPPTTPYGWPLEAVPFIGPSLSPYTVNNDAMGIYNSQYLNACKVDIALYMLNDYGVTADIDHYRGVMLH
jgi:hypothetical protein